MINFKKQAVNGLIGVFIANKTQKTKSISIPLAKEILSEIKHLFYPDNIKPSIKSFSKKAEIKRLFKLIDGQIKAVLNEEDKKKSGFLALRFTESFYEIKKMLDKDLQAFILSDPAAKSKEEVILCYPGFHAIFIYRLAHKLDELNIPILPRLFTEIAHGETGIDIHPSAKIGEYFFIDHGTGVVIGETTEIANRVKLYQGVTLGAVSLENVEDLQGVKRHPAVSDGVTIYANATILGGETIIGENVTIRSGAFITKSVPPV